MLYMAEESLSKRTFYFHNFIYFIEEECLQGSDTINYLVRYIYVLSILFDLILIPMGHLTVSRTDRARAIKEKFLTHPFVAALVRRGIIVTTIWSHCNEISDHLEACDRYLVDVGARNFYFPQITKLFSDIMIFKRDASYQSERTKSYWPSNVVKSHQREFDFMNYQDGGFSIPFSHEKLILGKGRTYQYRQDFINHALFAYISAMPDGNGLIFRAPIGSLECKLRSVLAQTKGLSPTECCENIYKKNNHEHIVTEQNCNLPIDPILLREDILHNFINYLFKIVFPKFEVMSNEVWVHDYLHLTNENICLQKFRRVVFDVFGHLSQFGLSSAREIDAALKSVQLIPISFLPILFLPITIIEIIRKFIIEIEVGIFYPKLYSLSFLKEHNALSLAYNRGAISSYICSTNPPILSAKRKYNQYEVVFQEEKAMTDLRNKVFVVYGRDEPRRRAVFDLLRAANLQPMEWEEIVRLTGKGTPYVGEVLDKGFEVAQAIVVLFTGDDLAKLNPDLVLENEVKEEWKKQPRPNVLLEAGMALGKNPDRTIILQIGELREISDLSGRHIVYLRNDIRSRKTLLDRLENAGCPVNLKGSDWMSAGTF